MRDRDTILNFIYGFHNYGTKKQIIECFTYGYCYWFANILLIRFGGRAEIVYDQVENHFGCRIDDEVYDITGIVTNQYNWESWAELREKDSLLTQRVERDSILKEN